MANRSGIPIETNELCIHGCGNRAKYINKSKNLSCEMKANSCPAVRKRNSEKIRQAHLDGRIPGWNDLSKKYKLSRGWAKGLTKETDARVLKGSETKKQRIKDGLIVVKGSKHSEETKKKLSKFRSEWLRVPENRKNLGRQKPSWMETTFKTYLQDNNISGWDTEVQFWNDDLQKNYFPDFIFEEMKLIIELDGTQHEKTKEKDKIRDEWFGNNGYTVIRIKHSEFKERYFSEVGFLDLLRM